MGECPEVMVQIGGVSVKCLLDTGSQVSTISESFFRQHLSGTEEDVMPTSNWLKLTAANNLPIPYLGYVELDMQTMGLTIPECGFLVSKDPDADKSGGRVEESKLSHKQSFQDLVPCLIGMNIIKRCKQLVTTEFDTTLKGELDVDWRTVFQRVQTCDLVKQSSAVRLMGKDSIHVPAWSVTTVHAKASRPSTISSTYVLEPSQVPLPGDIVVMPTVVGAVAVIPVQVVNFTQEDVWLPPRTRLGLLSPVECIDNHQTEVRFQRISADQEEVSIDQKGRRTEQDAQSILDQLDMGSTEEERAKLAVLLSKYAEVFAVKDEDLGHTDIVKHEIHLLDDTPVAQPYRRIPPTQYSEVREHISQLLKKGVIQESTSAYASPIVLVRKSDGSLRLCVDYRRLNAKTRRGAFPLPRIEECFDALHGARFFSSIDLASGYHQDSLYDAFWAL